MLLALMLHLLCASRKRALIRIVTFREACPVPVAHTTQSSFPEGGSAARCQTSQVSCGTTSTVGGVQTWEVS